MGGGGESELELAGVTGVLSSQVVRFGGVVEVDVEAVGFAFLIR